MSLNVNLLRNSRLLATTNVDSFGAIRSTGCDAINTQELSILSNLTLSQAVTSEVVSLSEAGETPARGSQSFSTAIEAASLSFSTYIRPVRKGTTPNFTVDDESTIVLNAMVAAYAEGTTYTCTVTGVTYVYAEAVPATKTPATGTLTFAGVAGNTMTVGQTVLIGGLLGANQAENAYLNGGGIVTVATATTLQIELSILSPVAISAITLATAGAKFYRSGIAPSVASLTPFSMLSPIHSNLNSFVGIGFIAVIDGVTYALDGATINDLNIDLGIDQISTMAFTCQAKSLREVAIVFGAANTMTGDIAGSYAAKETAAPYITNKVSTVDLILIQDLKDASGATVVAAGRTYNIALTAGSFSLSNNVTWLTPEMLGAVATSIGSFTGARTITGTLNMYLKKGLATEYGSAALIADMLKGAQGTVAPMFYMSLGIGGKANPTKVIFDFPAVGLAIPSVNVEQVVTVAAEFTASPGYGSVLPANRGFTLSKTNEFSARWHVATS